MREFKLQKAWDNYRDDYGLGRILIFIASYNLFLFFLTTTFFNSVHISFFIPLVISFCFFHFRHKIIKQRPIHIFFLMFVPMGIAIGFNYFLIGKVDRMAGGLTRIDPFMVSFEFELFGDLLGHRLETLITSLGMFGRILFELMMISYLLFYLLPYLGAIRFYLNLKDDVKFIIGRFMASLMIFHSLNYIFYLMIPITGPQHFMPYHFTNSLDFFFLGEWIHSIIHLGQSNYIDCFPSGHLGSTLLVTIWMFRIKDKIRYPMLILTCLIALATLALRYHYLLDLIAAIPLAFVSYYLGRLLIPVTNKREDYL